MNHSFNSFLEHEKAMSEGNAFSAALKKAKEDGKDEFEVDGETYKVEEADEAEETAEEPKAPKLMSFDDFVKDKSTISSKSDDTAGQKVATDDEVNAKLPSDDKEEDKEKEDLEDKEAKDDAKGEEEEEEEEEVDLDDLDD
jgi:hypothetical protein